MADHVFDLYVEQDWIGMKLRCTHGGGLPWFGDYDEEGDLASMTLREDCWAKEFADDDGWFIAKDLVNPTFPMPVRVWFDGNGLSVEREP